ncbi:MAG TPA: SdpI family protein [Verrucomicrobiae bacterium]|nr:SdpI family protein [Verrucomicrobiae bacterium]
MTSLASKFLILGIVTLLLVLPLVFRKVPMNRYYGFRTKAAFQSEQNWYEINARGGRMMAWGSLAILLVGAIGFFIPEKYTLLYIGGALIVIAIAIVVPLVSFIGWQRRFGP